MTNLQQAYKQTSHRYNPDYAYLDSGEDLDWYWWIASETKSYDDEGGVYYNHLINVIGEHTIEDFKDVMRDEFRRGCSCEYDCCGHYFGGAGTIKQLSKCEYIVVAAYHPNY